MRRLQQKMIMVVHKYKGVDNEIKAIVSILQNVKEHLPVKIIPEDYSAGIAPRSYMIKSVFVFNPKRTSHGGLLVRHSANVKNDYVLRDLTPICRFVKGKRASIDKRQVGKSNNRRRGHAPLATHYLRPELTDQWLRISLSGQIPRIEEFKYKLGRGLF